MSTEDNGAWPLEDPQKEIELLEAEYAGLTERQKQCNLLARELMEKEASGEGIFAREIYEKKQQSIILATEMQHIRAKINRIKLGLGMI